MRFRFGPLSRDMSTAPADGAALCAAVI